MLAGRDFKQITQRLLEFAENVSYFDISFNELENFPDFISEMIHVQFFIANHNHLNYLEGRFFQTFEKLVRLDLAFNKLVQIPEEITEIATLQELYLNDNQLTDISELIRLLSKSVSLHLPIPIPIPIFLPDSFSHNCFCFFLPHLSTCK